MSELCNSKSPNIGGIPQRTCQKEKGHDGKCQAPLVGPHIVWQKPAEEEPETPSLGDF